MEKMREGVVKCIYDESLMTEVSFLCKSPGTEKVLAGTLGSPEGTRMSTEDSENWLFRAALERALSSH